MSENYPSDVKLNENQDGTVSFATEVVATIAGLAATEVDGVASMSSPASGFADMFSRKNTRNFTKGVRIDLDGSKVTVDITIVVEYGSPVPDVARNIQENVKKAIETMSGLDVRSVDVHVSGISFEREQKANAELDEQHRKMLEKTAEEDADREVETPFKPVEKEAEPIEPEFEEEEPEEEDFFEEEEEELDEEVEDSVEEDEEEIIEIQDDAEDEPVEVAPEPEPAVEAEPEPVVEEAEQWIEDEPEIVPGDEEPAAFEQDDNDEPERVPEE